MTVCVAAFAEKSKALVMVSDKALTHSSVYGADTDIQKMLHVGKSNWRALVAGDPSFAKKVIRDAASEIQKDKTINETQFAMMNCVSRSYQKSREESVVDQILTPRLLTKELLTKELLVGRRSELLPLPGSYSDDVLRELRAFQAQCDLLLCGFDSGGTPHIFSVVEPGVSIDHDMSGYHAIGSGAAFAIAKLLSWDVNRNRPLAEVLYRAFDAKAHAEIVSTVGFAWDGYVLTRRRGWRVKLSVRKALDDLFVQVNRSPFDTSPKSRTRKKLQTRVLKFAATVMKRK